MREVRRLDNDFGAWWASQVIIEWEIAGGVVKIRYSALWSKLIRDVWNLASPRAADMPTTPDSARYDIELETVDANSLRYHGLRNGESVTLTVHGFDTTSFSSSTPAVHPDYTYPGPKVPDCSMTDARDWFDQFREANRRPGP
ncbi:MAG: hypothetical protein JF616_08845 [Fibrobacteres bacterium]|nr:hypothetical protein [Fibrobacterota bacterium]